MLVATLAVSLKIDLKHVACILLVVGSIGVVHQAALAA
jgi:hypothetical protein